MADLSPCQHCCPHRCAPNNFDKQAPPIVDSDAYFAMPSNTLAPKQIDKITLADTPVNLENNLSADAVSADAVSTDVVSSDDKRANNDAPSDVPQMTEDKPDEKQPPNFDPDKLYHLNEIIDAFGANKKIGITLPAQATDGAQLLLSVDGQVVASMKLRFRSLLLLSQNNDLLLSVMLSDVVLGTMQSTTISKESE